jgi:hypothetical protein
VLESTEGTGRKARTNSPPLEQAPQRADANFGSDATRKREKKHRFLSKLPPRTGRMAKYRPGSPQGAIIPFLDSGAYNDLGDAGGATSDDGFRGLPSPDPA